MRRKVVLVVVLHLWPLFVLGVYKAILSQIGTEADFPTLHRQILMAAFIASLVHIPVMLVFGLTRKDWVAKVSLVGVFVLAQVAIMPFCVLNMVRP